MDKTEILQTVMSFALIIIGAVAIYARIKLRWAEARLERLEHREEERVPATAQDADSERLERLEAGLDRLEARLDQLAEGQEFLGRVLTDRVVETRRPPRSTEATPH